MKKILLLALPYHGYTSEIIQELKINHYEVTFFPIKPRTFLHKVLQTVSPRFFQRYLNSYHLNLINNEQPNIYDIVLFIQVHFLSLKNLDLLLEKQKNAKFILYNWDSVKTHDYRDYISRFNKVATFDPEDAENYKLEYIPLFCIKSFQNLGKIQNQQKSIYFVGNIVNVERYNAIKALKKYCAKEGLKVKTYLKCTPVTYFRLIINFHFPLAVHFNSISIKKFIEMMGNSSTVFDFANHTQNGYTMRFIENLCAKKKIITNNKNVVRESFYENDRFFLFMDFNFIGLKNFIETPLKNPYREFPEYYLNNFLKKLLDCQWVLSKFEISIKN